NVDGSLAGRPQIVNAEADRLFQAVADSASRATQRCAPLSIPAEFVPFYEDWKTMVVNFDPRDA
ncbi:MAG TPA: cell envelope biogenesis protein TolA, partial [Saliniramus sp.]|nr:cell envelope biogenesis protein TolA [Saliniramus sp.]